MQNQFDTSNYLDGEPDKLTAGEFWAWKRSDADAVYPVASYTLRYFFYLQSDEAYSFNLDSVDDGNGAHLMTAASAATEVHRPGSYLVNIFIERNSDNEKIKLGQALVELLPALTFDGGDIRTHAQKVLDAIKATIEKTATKEQASYSIAGRSLARRSISELIELKTEYQRLVNAERRKKSREQGKGKSQLITHTMSGA